MSNFKVGEIAIFQNAIHELARNGQECEVIEGLKIRQVGIVDHEAHIIRTEHLSTYVIRFQDGRQYNCLPSQLRRKKPPCENDSNTICSWDDCGWNPHKIKEYS